VFYRSIATRTLFLIGTFGLMILAVRYFPKKKSS
jgi:hypothetical protein